jgi:hypothetical protein
MGKVALKILGLKDEEFYEVNRKSHGIFTIPDSKKLVSSLFIFRAWANIL